MFTSISAAVKEAEPGTFIRITSNIYDEQVVITTKDIVLETKDKHSEVILSQRENPCITIDVGDDNYCTINNLKMILKGPNKDADIRSFQTNMNFSTHCREQVMREFFIHKPEQMYCIVMLKSGRLRLNNCHLSLDGIFKETYRKVPCIAVLHN